MDTKIEHLPAQRRFEATLDGARGHLEYRLRPGVMTIVHTEVDPALEGHGVAGALVRAALDHAGAGGLKVDPVCSYAAAHMQRHPEAMSLRA